MKAIDLANHILALPPEQQQLDICSMEECWAIQVHEPKLVYLNNKNVPQEFDNLSGKPVILI